MWTMERPAVGREQEHADRFLREALALLGLHEIAVPAFCLSCPYLSCTSSENHFARTRGDIHCVPLCFRMRSSLSREVAVAVAVHVQDVAVEDQPDAGLGLRPKTTRQYLGFRLRFVDRLLGRSLPVDLAEIGRVPRWKPKPRSRSRGQLSDHIGLARMCGD